MMFWLMSNRITSGFYRAVAAGALLVVLVLLADFRSLKDTLLAIVPLVIAITMRCIIRGRPPVTTLYETILFITATGAITAPVPIPNTSVIVPSPRPLMTSSIVIRRSETG